MPQAQTNFILKVTEEKAARPLRISRPKTIAGAEEGEEEQQQEEEGGDDFIEPIILGSPAGDEEMARELQRQFYEEANQGN